MYNMLLLQTAVPNYRQLIKTTVPFSRTFQNSNFLHISNSHNQPDTDGSYLLSEESIFSFVYNIGSLLSIFSFVNTCIIGLLISIFSFVYIIGLSLLSYPVYCSCVIFEMWTGFWKVSALHREMVSHKSV